MNKILKTASIFAVLVAVVAFVGVAAAFAQEPNQAGGATAPRMNQATDGSNPGMGLMAVDEATMHAAIADALYMSLDEFETAVAAGKTPLILAQEKGIDFAEVQAAMDAVHEAALQQAVDDGLISQGQANWILSHRGGQNGQGNGMNSGSGPKGRAGSGPANNGARNGGCQYQTP